MTTANQTSPGLTVQAIMTDKVHKAKLHWSAQELAQFFSEHSITGAPVVDINDQLVGVVTVTDLIKVAGFEQEKEELSKVQAYYEEFLGQAVSEKETQQLMDVAQASFGVEDIMSASVLQVACDAPIKQVAALMVKEKVHRVFVTEKQQLAGVVSTMDILRWYADQE